MKKEINARLMDLCYEYVEEIDKSPSLRNLDAIRTLKNNIQLNLQLHGTTVNFRDIDKCVREMIKQDEDNVFKNLPKKENKIPYEKPKEYAHSEEPYRREYYWDENLMYQ